MEGSGKDSSPVSMEAGWDPDHLPAAEAGATLSKVPSKAEGRSRRLPTGSPSLGYLNPLHMASMAWAGHVHVAQGTQGTSWL